MNSKTARELYQRKLDAFGKDREQVIKNIHDRLARDQREKIEHAYTQYREQQGADPVLLMVDVLYDEFGEELGVSLYGWERIDELQRNAFYAEGYAPIIFAFSPQGARDLLCQRFPAKDADTALLPSPPGKVKLFICSMNVMSGYDANMTMT
jgi:hypothetical protein